MICQKCNFQNEETAKFCKNCGNKLSIKSPKIKKKNITLPWIIGSFIVATVTVICIVIWGSKAEKTDNDLARFNLKGKVYGVEQRTYVVQNENDEIEENNRIELIVDWPLDYIKFWESDRDRIISEADQVSKKRYERYGQKLPSFYKFLFYTDFDLKFNKNGNMKQVTFADFQTVYFTDDDKMKKKNESCVDTENGLNYKYTYEYDNEDRLTGLILNYEDNIIPSWITFDYENGKVIKSSVKQDFTLYYDYNEKGQIKTIKYNKVKNNANYIEDKKYRYDYNDCGNIAKLSVLESISYYREYSINSYYSKNHNVEWVWEYEYEYDQKGNWIKRIEKGTVKSAEGEEINKNYYSNESKSLQYPKEGMTITLVTTRKIDYNKPEKD